MIRLGSVALTPVSASVVVVEALTLFRPFCLAS